MRKSLAVLLIVQSVKARLLSPMFSDSPILRYECHLESSLIKDICMHTISISKERLCLIKLSKFKYIDYFFYIVSTSCESSQIKCRILSNSELMNHKVPIVALLAVILLVATTIAVLTPTLANAKIRTHHIRLYAMGEGLPGLVGLSAAQAPPGPAVDPPAFGYTILTYLR
jgi:hypothetical protein